MTPREAFGHQSRACIGLGSPFIGRLMGLFADRLCAGTPVADRILGWTGDTGPAGQSVPLRVAGALHALKLQGTALTDVYPPNEPDDEGLWSAVADALEAHEDPILTWLDRPPQTNEVRRAAVVIAALHHLQARFGLPVDLIELGCSGGLNLRADWFELRLGAGRLGRAGSPVVLAPDWTGPIPPAGPATVVSRSGVDLTAIDPDSDAGRLRLLSYLWPDQEDRIARTDAAISIAREAPASLASASADQWLSEVLACKDGRLQLVFNTVAWQYFPPKVQDRCAAILAAAGAHATSKAPLAHLAMEADRDARGAALTLRLWPGGKRLELGRADFHLRWVDWNPDLPRLP